MHFRHLLCGLAIFACALTIHARAADTAELAPGTKVIVDFGGKNNGEIVERMASGWYKVRITRLTGRDTTVTLPPSKVQVASGNQASGKAGASGRMQRPGLTRPSIGEGGNTDRQSGSNSTTTSTITTTTKSPSGSTSTTTTTVTTTQGQGGPLAGTWIVIGQWFDGRRVFGGDDTIVFDRNTCDLFGRKQHFAADETQQPKQIDLWTDKTKMQGIYEINGDELRICVDDTKAASRPTTLTPKEGQMLRVFCCKQTNDRALKALFAQEIAAHQQKVIDRLQAGVFDGALSLLIPPSVAASQKPEDRTKSVEALESRSAKFIATYKALKTLTPEMREHPIVAFYDLKANPIDGGIPVSWVKLSRIEGRWYFDAK